jgi:prepilin-type N-terminal cleavage/methylation domain-containing protein
MRRRGFTLLELITVVAIIAIAAVIVVPNYIRSRERQRIKSRSRELIQAIQFARSEAASGRIFATAPVERRVVQAGIRFNDDRTYDVFVDDDDDPTDITVVRSFALDDNQSPFIGAQGGDEVRVVEVTVGNNTDAPPAATEIRFRRNGTLSQPVEVEIELEDASTNQIHAVSVSYAGQARIARISAGGP